MTNFARRLTDGLPKSVMRLGGERQSRSPIISGDSVSKN
jgi:hypothetical protein